MYRLGIWLGVFVLCMYLINLGFFVYFSFVNSFLIIIYNLEVFMYEIDKY